MKTEVKIYLFICLALYPAVFLSKYLDINPLEKIFIPLFVSVVFLFSLKFNPPRLGNNIYLAFAFLCVCLGDFIVNLTNWGGWFIVPFVLVHVNLIIYFSKEKKWEASDWLPALPVIFTSILVFLLVMPHIPELSRKIVFIFYLLLLSTMLWRANCIAWQKKLAIEKFLITGGALLFYVTDICVATNIEVKQQFLVAITWICYVPSLVMLSLMNYPFRK